jgi:uncharacterized membrane protein (UPF0127 family)
MRLWALAVLIVAASATACLGYFMYLQTICFDPGNVCYRVDFADTPAEREKGLMDRRVLFNDGMLFDFGEPTGAKFWMKNTLIPLQAVWLDADGRVLGSTAMIPCPADMADCPIYPAPAPVRWVLEIPDTSTAPSVGSVMRH